MAKAVWNGAVIAESDTYEVVEGNVYFPEASVDRRYVKPSEHTSICGWKGTAKYLDVVVDGQVNGNAAWYYSDPKPAAANIRNHVGFWNGVRVVR